jgi:hypothetical protein
MSKEDVDKVKKKYDQIKSELDERGRRIWAASESLSLGYGGIKTVEQGTGITERTILRGRKEIEEVQKDGSSIIRRNKERRIRQNGGGRKRIQDTDGKLIVALEKLVESTTRGDPMSPLLWTCKSTRNLSAELLKIGYEVSHTKVAQLLSDLNYSLQSLRKTKEGGSHPDRNAQFEYINEQVKEFQKKGQPVVSVDAKKKELIGDYANKGREYQPKGKPEEVNVYDFIDKELGKVCPYGIYDITANNGWVSVGTDHDTAQFAVESIRRWWYQMGCKVYLKAEELFITADGGGSNSSRGRLWKIELQKLADETSLNIFVSHFPPGTSKWNKIEHRMFCHITENWRGRPLKSHEVVVNLIGNTRTKQGLEIQTELDKNHYPTGIKITKQQMKEINLHRSEFHGKDWNYQIKPNRL